MDRKDKLILAYLRQNARMTLCDMSRKIKVPVSTIFDRIKTNTKGTIIKHTALIDFEKLGYSARANIIIKVEREHKDAMKDFLIRHHYVNSVLKINNGYDFLVEGIFKDVKQMEDFMDVLEDKFKIHEKMSFFVIDDLKREGFMADPEMLPI